MKIFFYFFVDFVLHTFFYTFSLKKLNYEVLRTKTKEKHARIQSSSSTTSHVALTHAHTNKLNSNKKSGTDV